MNILSRGEQLALKLKGLYLSYGYRPYRLPGFDEYSLYAENRSFLAYKDVVSFSAGGRLLALRPDVTLSVVKNVNVEEGGQKLFYNEKVYRKTAGGGFAEMDQIGVEVIGEVDVCAEAEVALLALKTLQAAGRKYSLEISHAGIIAKAADGLRLSAEKRRFALSCLEKKNAHDFLRFAANEGVPQEAAEAFSALIALPAEPDRALEALGGVAKLLDIGVEAGEISSIVSVIGAKNVTLNFSAVGDDEYYNGLIFKGYIEGVPQAALSGGRYDKLLRKFSKDAQAIGFALYFGELEKYLGGGAPMPDGAVVYKDAPSAVALATAEKLRAEGSILLCKTLPRSFCGKVYSAYGKPLGREDRADEQE